MGNFLTTLGDVGGTFAGVPGAGSLFNGILSLFGDNRRKLTTEDWNNYFPGSGSWTTRIRSYLSASIKYDVDVKYIEEFIKNFVYENLTEISGGKYTTSNIPNGAFMLVVNDFYKILSAEKNGESVPNILYFENRKKDVQSDSESKPVSVPTTVWFYVGGAVALLFLVPKLFKR